MSDHVVSIQASDVQGEGQVQCPRPETGLWNQHPRIFVKLDEQGQGRCPYCGTVYRLAEGASLSHGH